MLYHFFTYLNNRFDFPGSGLFEFISFKAALAVITSLVITLVFGGKLIRFLHQKQVGETVRDLGLDGQLEKTGTPTMGGIIILAGILIPTLLFADLSNIYIQLMLISTVLLGAFGYCRLQDAIIPNDVIKILGKYLVSSIYVEYPLFYETSAKNGMNINKSFDNLAKSLLLVATEGDQSGFYIM